MELPSEVFKDLNNVIRVYEENGSLPPTEQLVELIKKSASTIESLAKYIEYASKQRAELSEASHKNELDLGDAIRKVAQLEEQVERYGRVIDHFLDQ